MSGPTETANPVGQQVNQLLGTLMPQRIPAVTGAQLPETANAESDGSAVMNQVEAALLGAVSAQGGTGVVPFQSNLSRLMGQDLFAQSEQEIAFIDASQYTTQESLNDQPIINPIFAMPWAERYELEIKTYMPLFTLRADSADRAPGFNPVATPVIINNLQARLLQAERDEALYGAGGMMADRQPQRRRVVGNAAAMPRSRRGNNRSTRTLQMLRNFGALSAEELHRKLYFLGPVAQVYDSSGSHATQAANYYGNPTSERIIAHTLYSRGKINNMFDPALEKGDQLYFSLIKCSRDELASFGAGATQTNSAAALNRKRKGDAQYVNVERRTAAASDEFVQVRGWSSRNAHAFLGNTSPLDAMRPEAQDRFYVEREMAAAVEYREYEYDADSDTVRLVDNLAEGVQEALNNVPDVVLENYLASGVVIPVGTVKTPLPKRVTGRAILNAHFNHDALAALPHIDIYQNGI